MQFVKYTNRLTLPTIVGMIVLMYGIFYTTLSGIVLRDGHNGEFVQSVNYVCFTFGAILLLLGSPAIMLRWSWGRKISSIGCFVLIGMLIIFSIPEILGMMLVFIFPLIGLLLLLHCNNFIHYFSHKESKTEQSFLGKDETRFLWWKSFRTNKSRNILGKIINYKHNLSFPFVFGILCLIYVAPFLYLGWIGLTQPAIPTIHRALFFYYGLGGLVVMFFLPSFVQAKEIGRIAFLIGFFLIVFALIVTMPLSWKDPKDLFNTFFFIIPMIPILLMLQSEYFKEFFQESEEYMS